jgi:hypothetical protein
VGQVRLEEEAVPRFKLIGLFSNGVGDTPFQAEYKFDAGVDNGVWPASGLRGQGDDKWFKCSVGHTSPQVFQQTMVKGGARTAAGLHVDDGFSGHLGLEEGRDGHLEHSGDLLQRADTGRGFAVFNEAEGIHGQTALFGQAPDGEGPFFAEGPKTAPHINIGAWGSGGVVSVRFSIVPLVSLSLLPRARAWAGGGLVG